MIKTDEIIQELISQIKRCVPESSNYKEERPEEATLPLFSYYIVFNDSKQVTRSTRSVTLDIQVICFVEQNAKGIPSSEKKIMVMDKLDGFLNQFKLKVKDRWLKFKYSRDDVDGNLALNIKFKYIDGVNDPVRKEEESRKPAENIHILYT